VCCAELDCRKPCDLGAVQSEVVGRCVFCARQCVTEGFRVRCVLCRE